MSRRVCAFALLAVLAGRVPAGPVVERLVSLDYCADQYALELLAPERILALSPDAEADFSYHRDKARGIAKVRPAAEDVIALRPAAILRSYGGGPRAARFFVRAGIPVIQVPYVSDLAGVRDAVITVAGELGVPARGDEIVARMERRLAALEPRGEPVRAMYVTAGGATSGTGTLIDEMLEAAGLVNFTQRPGWHSVALEELAYDQPELVIAAFFESSTPDTAYWSSMRHPVARRQLQRQPTVMLDGAWTSCGGWFLLDAIEALSSAEREPTR